MSSNVVKTMRQLRVPDAHRIEFGDRTSSDLARESEQAVRDMLRQAEEQAQQIVNDARHEAETVREAARAKGYEEGRESIWAELKSATAQQWKPVHDATQGIFAQIAVMTDWSRWCQEEVTIDVARAMAEAVLASAVKDRPEWFSEYLGRALEALDESAVRVAVGDGLVAQLEGMVEHLRDQVQITESFVDRTLPAYDVRLQSEGLTVVAGIETALQQLVEGMRYGNREL